LMVSADNRRELLQTLQSLLRDIREQKGCLGSHLYFEIGDEDAICLMEEWATREDLNDYLRSNHFVVLLGAARILKKSSEFEFKLLTQTDGIEVVEAIHGKINL
ncbi:MAG: antibiotic biosynthesis monooxygenase, partial [Acidobacteria bacterium]|nr:antibiotic biosynthesis monooxygenase [Acidobacteriota bacterium]